MIDFIVLSVIISMTAITVNMINQGITFAYYNDNGRNIVIVPIATPIN